MIVVAPVFISAGIYFSINRLIAWANSIGGFDAASEKKYQRWWLSPKLILWGFITADALTTIMQIAGAAMVGSSESNSKSPDTGNNILLAGLAIQTASFAVFLVILLLFRISLGKDAGVRSNSRSKDAFILAVAVASLLVYLRTVFRLAETAQGIFGSVSTNEKFFGSLEFAPVVLAVWILAIWHPGRWLAKEGSRVFPPAAQQENESVPMEQAPS